MLRNVLSVSRVLILTGAAVLLTAGACQAAPHAGGFHAGGFHAGGFHSGGFHSGGFHSGGFNRGFNGSFHHGDLNRGFHGDFNRGFHHGGFNRGFGLGYGYGYPGFGYGYPSYDYGYPSYGYAYPSYYPSGGGLYGDLGTTTSAYYTPPDDAGPYTAPVYDFSANGAAEPAPRANDGAATVTVRVPPDAEVWFDGKRTTQRGEDRVYQSPPLRGDTSYTYDVRARWSENGKATDETRHITVHANGRTEVDFTKPESSK
jgi:uncharacterized protein (TIGR03000 family)